MRYHYYNCFRLLRNQSSLQPSKVVLLVVTVCGSEGSNHDSSSLSGYIAKNKYIDYSTKHGGYTLFSNK